MGIRLYPNTNNATSLEILAGVSPGTKARLDAIEARHEAEKAAASKEEHYDLGYKQWGESNDDRELGTLSHFLLYGWGKFNALLGVAMDECCGELTDPIQIRRLFQINGIPSDDGTLALSEGVHWS